MKIYMKKLLALAIVTVIAACSTPPKSSAPQQQDIFETAVAAGSFNTLVAAVQAAGLVDTLKSSGPLPRIGL